MLWGSAFVAIRAALRDYSPQHLSLLRIACAAFALAALLAVGGVGRPRRGDLARISATGLVGVTAYQLLLNTGEVVVSAATASFLVAVAPVFAAILARAVLKERLRFTGWIGVLLAFAGTALVALTAGSVELSGGAVLVVGAALCQAVFFVLQKPLLKTYSPVEVTSYAMWVGLVPLLLAGDGTVDAVRSAGPSANFSVLWLGLGGSALAFVTWAHALRHIPLSVAAPALYLCPVVATASGWIVLDEAPRAATLAAGAVVLAGVTIVTRWGRDPSGRIQA